MNWLNPQNAHPSDYDPNARVAGFMKEAGQLGQIALEAWNAVDPLRCFYEVNSDEYLGYATRFVELVVRAIPGKWSEQPDLVEELVRRSFYPSQVCKNVRTDHTWVTMESIKAISLLITEEVERLGGMEKLLQQK